MKLEELTIKEVEEWLDKEEYSSTERLEALKNDSRKGVQSLVRRHQRKLEAHNKLIEMHQDMLKFEWELYDQGYQHIAGIDEVGRGPLAGPVVTAAVILPKDFQLLGLNDSKKLSKEKREKFAEIIKKEALSYSIIFSTAAEIDQLNIYQATKKAMEKAVQSLSLEADHLLVDAMNLTVDIPQTSLIKGDARSLSIAASSCLAKVARDTYMEQLHKKFPQYHFDKNMGYGTKEHLEGIKKFGILPSEHRKSFQPVSESIRQSRQEGTGPVQTSLF
ncbi:putative ribonuclease HII [Bacillus sp. TS-2]|nr:putative ribonuclease HII [Bacillus sp. TS-2]